MLEAVVILFSLLEVLKGMRCVLLLYILPGEIPAEFGWGLS